VSALRRRDETFLDDLARLLSSGMSHSQAATALAVSSRNVTIGIVHRARAAGDVRFGADACAAALAKQRADRASKPLPKATPRRRPMPRLVVDSCLSDLPMFSPRAAFLSFAPPTEQKSIVDVGARECRFIGDDPKTGALCCAGHTDLGVSYCEYHTRLVWSGRRA
jgi:hypothetical protein